MERISISIFLLTTFNIECNVRISEDLLYIKNHTHLIFGEDAVLREMVVEVASVHEVQDEAEFVCGLEGIVQVDHEGAVHLGQHVLLVQSQRLPFL